eukprot:TRINITY_DN36901_c0_g1_i2.p1 TRINITY_DN36901_c0_g1~~TRINITY_DN36901_c0_g1_i2.p1  ORF type:complete len:182 (+),score=33.17 TRINITY_DN36901_c0_g1_i2:89-634(+)
MTLLQSTRWCLLFISGLPAKALANDLSTKYKKFEESDPLLMKTSHRDRIYPIEYHEVWKMYKHHQSYFWTTEEASTLALYDEDKWQALGKDEQLFVQASLLYYATRTAVIVDTLETQFSEEVQIPEGRMFYDFQIMMENVHLETYEMLVERYEKPEDEASVQSILRLLTQGGHLRATSALV